MRLAALVAASEGLSHFRFSFRLSLICRHRHAFIFLPRILARFTAALPFTLLGADGDFAISHNFKQVSLFRHSRAVTASTYLDIGLIA